MDQRQIEELHSSLTQKRQNLREAIKRDNQELERQLKREGRDDGHLDFNHPADMVAGDPDYEKELNLLQRERDELAQVNEALERIAEGDYGICDECGQEIGFARLTAVPETTHCISCQEALDRARH
ncbi:RNA polymerase-binding protein DksA [Proteobacteria bacterium 005FR1]|nr:RNA polymerase-binding protein DksA [Proteobacteria bacterium 005FR1]